MKKLILFLITGLVFGGVPEFVNQILIKHSLKSFFVTLGMYFVFSVVLYLLRKRFRQFNFSIRVSFLFWFVFWGIFGICIEWFLLGNRSVAWYGQIAMFSFWAGMASIPVIFTEQQVHDNLRKQIIYYLSIWYVLIVVTGLLNPGLGLMIWILGSIGLIYFIYKYYISLNAPKYVKPIN